MKIEKIQPTCNLDTVKDGRGGIFTFIPKKPIVEFNLNIIKAGNLRGNHNHPEFDEYYLITSGEGVLIFKENKNSKEEFVFMSKGQCTCTPLGISHVFLAITDCTIVTMLTKKWDDCEQPIIHENLGMGTGDHGDLSSPFFQKN